MRRRSFLISATALTTLLFLWSPGMSAQVKNDLFTRQASSDVPKASSQETVLLPVQLTDERIQALQQLPPLVLPVKQIGPHQRVGFYRSAYNRPLTPREVAFRESVYELAARHKQFVHVHLADGKALTGTIDFASAEAFLLQTNILGSGHLIHYRQLAEPPRPVLAVGTRTIRGLETTGLVALCILAIPVAVVLYPLIAAGVIKD